MKSEREDTPLPEAERRFVGVDVVDLTDPRARDRSRDARFLDRVFSPGERERIRAAADPALEVWILWAAKEAAFKVVSKLQAEPPVFRHAAYEVTDEPGLPVTALRYRDTPLALGVEAHGERVLVWAWNEGAPEILVARATVPGALAALGLEVEREAWETSRFRPGERDSIHGLPSALVRLMARRDAARMLGIAEDLLSIECPPGHTGLRPPYLHRSGALLRHADVSLSHDGRELAWAVRVVRSPGA